MRGDITAIGSTPGRARRAPHWFWAAGTFGALWNTYGAVQFLQAVTATRDSLVAMGMTEVQAQTMTSYPLWMTVAFAVGTLGGLAASCLMLVRRKIAVPAFAVSLVGYLALYVGDITEGVFAALGAGQIAILSLVVVIASGLLWASRRAADEGILA